MFCVRQSLFSRLLGLAGDLATSARTHERYMQIHNDKMKVNLPLSRPILPNLLVLAGVCLSCLERSRSNKVLQSSDVCKVYTVRV